MNDRIETQTQDTCPLCDSRGFHLESGLRDRSFDTPGEWSLRSCNTCALVWLDPRPDRETIPRLYEDYFTHEAPGEDTGVRRILYRGIPTSKGHGKAKLSPVAQFTARVLARFGPLEELAQQAVMWLQPRPKGRLLDVGCGSGMFLTRMRDLGWEVAGIDADPAAAAVAREALGDATIVCGDLDDGVFAGQCFDAITLSHVIEHLPDPSRTIAACRGLLSPSGQLIVSTPNAFSLGRTEFEAAWLHWDPPRHLQIFNPVNLSKLVKSAGFEVKACFTPSTSSVAVWAGSQTIRRRGRLPGVRISRAKWRDIVGGFTFWLREYRAVRAGGRCGEDLVVIATPTTGEWSPS